MTGLPDGSTARRQAPGQAATPAGVYPTAPASVIRLATAPGRAHAMKEPRPGNQAASRKESAQPGTSPEPAPARAV